MKIQIVGMKLDANLKVKDQILKQPLKDCKIGHYVTNEFRGSILMYLKCFKLFGVAAMTLWCIELPYYGLFGLCF